MEILETLQWPLAQNLAYRIVNKLDRVSRKEDVAGKIIEVTGHLPLASIDFSTRKKARCIFSITHEWPWKIPKIICLEDWLTRGPDWHVDQNGRLCVEFDMRWKHELASMIDRYTYGLTADYASEWLVSSTQSLLHRHLLAFRSGLKVWSKDWDFWDHELEPAKRQFFRERKKGEHEQNRATANTEHRIGKSRI